MKGSEDVVDKFLLLSNLPVQFAHRNHNWLEKSAQSKLFLCEAEIRLFRRYLYDRNQFVKY